MRRLAIPDTMDPMVELVGGRYRVAQRLGQGGMGAVYRVVDQSTGRALALKRLVGGDKGAASEQAQLRFRREFHAMVRLRHPRIVEVYDYGVDASGPYYTMELLGGKDLKDMPLPMPVHKACALLRDVAAALAYLHTRGLIHRDLTPRNVRCTEDGRARLIDFGVLATVGLSQEVAGTPPFIAPETLRRGLLDHRADLYALGALAYWLLTGQHAYPARTVHELESLWQRPPTPLSGQASQIPEALDDLVMTLLCVDPLGRPTSAPEVMDRLAAVAGLKAAPEIEVAQGYLASAAMVGRRREMDSIAWHVDGVMQGSGGAVVIEAPSGTGKSRLLRELGLEAKLAGVHVLTAQGESVACGPYGVLHELVRGLLATVPELTLATARPYATVLARLFPEMRASARSVKFLDTSGDPAELRLRAQRELVAWFLELAAAHPLAILIDDVQRSDEASAAVLATLARVAPDHSLFLAVALRTDEPVHAVAQVAAMREAGESLRLSGLTKDGVKELVHALFGKVPNARSLAHWMHNATGGSPLHCTELARRLVDRGLIRYLDGMWVLPASVRLGTQRSGLADAMEERIGRLSPRARSLAQALSVHRGMLPLALCLQVAGTPSEEEFFLAIDELVEQAVVVNVGEEVGFRHDGLREAALRGLTDKRRRDLHLRMGAALVASAQADEEHEAEIGWHLYEGGETERGAELLERAGRRRFNAQALADCIAPLEAALKTREQRRSSAASGLSLRYMLFIAGVLSNRAVALRHARSTLTAYRDHCGIAAAGRLGRFVGRHLGIVLGISWAFLRWLFRWPRVRSPSPLAALRRFLLVLGYSAGLHNATNDVKALRELLVLSRPVAVFKRRIFYASYLGVVANLQLALGHHHRAERTLRRALQIVEDDRLTPVSNLDHRLAGAGICSLLTIVDIAERNGKLEQDLAALESRDLQYFHLAAMFAKLANYRMRGEAVRAREQEAVLETRALQLGSMWIAEIKLLVGAQLSATLCRDVLSLKRCIEQLEGWVAEGIQMESLLELARGEYLRERGELEASKAALQRVITGVDPEEQRFRQDALSALSETLFASGDLEEGAKVARECIELGEHPEWGSLVPRLRCQRTLALIEAASGMTDAAIRRLDRAIDEARTIECAPMLGSLHEARARVALANGDIAGYKLHCSATAQLFAPTPESSTHRDQ